MFLDLDIMFKLFLELLNIKTAMLAECSFLRKKRNSYSDSFISRIYIQI